MYSLKGVLSEKFKRKIVAVLFVAVLLAEVGELFVTYLDSRTHFEVPDHTPEENKKYPTLKKIKSDLQHISGQVKHIR